MTIFRDDCGYEPLTAERAHEFGVPPEEAGFWFIEYEYNVPPIPGSIEHGQATSVRLIPNTLARLVSRREILIGLTIPKLP